MVAASQQVHDVVNNFFIRDAPVFSIGIKSMERFRAGIAFFKPGKCNGISDKRDDMFGSLNVFAGFNGHLADGDPSANDDE